ncbi:MAG: flagellar basal-body rod protein FlgF [Pseudomonadales bacterium]|nr:flagellar basal-body rod protein FlgF [Pseudomonadales bacterium]
MDSLVYVAMTGAQQNMTAQTVHSNNLANAGTTGFRADLAQARALQGYGEGLPVRIYAETEVPISDMSEGLLNSTGRNLDVALRGQGFLAVRVADGGEAFTRAGSLHVDAEGRLSTAHGHAVLGQGGPISLPPFEKILIGKDGSISIQPSGQGPEALVQAERLKLVKPDPQQISKGEDGLFHRIDGASEIAANDVELVSGFLETSNVNPVHEMTKIMQLARQFEISIQLMSTAQENDEVALSLMRSG